MIILLFIDINPKSDNLHDPMPPRPAIAYGAETKRARPPAIANGI